MPPLFAAAPSIASAGTVPLIILGVVVVLILMGAGLNMAKSRHEGDFHVKGALTADTFTAPDGNIDNSAIEANAGIEANKLQQRINKTYAQPNTAAADETRIIHVADDAGSLKAFSAGSIAKAVGDAVCTIDLKKNGTTVLSGVITIDSGNTNRVAEAGTISVPAYVEGDVFEVVIDGTIGTGTLPTGVFCNMVSNEAADQY